MSETVSAVLRAKPDIADRRAEAGAVARGLTMLFQAISFLPPVGCGHRDHLADRSCGCARAIALPVERLRLTPAPQSVADVAASLPTQAKSRRLRATKQPDGQINSDLQKSCQVENFCKSKYFCCRPTQISAHLSPSRPTQRALAIVTTRGGSRWTPRLRLTVAAEAYGESVWSWRP
jgi:hypothetical protein